MDASEIYSKRLNAKEVTGEAIILRTIWSRSESGYLSQKGRQINFEETLSWRQCLAVGLGHTGRRRQFGPWKRRGRDLELNLRSTLSQSRLLKQDSRKE